MRVQDGADWLLRLDNREPAEVASVFRYVLSDQPTGVDGTAWSDWIRYPEKLRKPAAKSLTSEGESYWEVVCRRMKEGRS